MKKKLKQQKKVRRVEKKSAYQYVREAHNSLLIAYAAIDPKAYYAEAVCRAMRNCALAMGQMPFSLIPKGVQK